MKLNIVDRIATGIVIRAETAIVKRFVDAKATDAASAISFEPEGRAQRRIFRRMTRFGAVLPAEDGRWFLDDVVLANFRKEELARLLGVIALTGFAAAGAIALGR
ncbi:hypothetical protein ACM61V_13990 [Sphingomonas sp. TX0543]|uniref:hypothetical protein n=1 Tax=unclassified Sphingomonas TaxID=196159 RepID=UPI0010F4DC14|nr:hypothetical protein [Sphingomonas sp. 3P27F8]